MALYRTVSLYFWTDPKVVDDFTPEDKYFYLYLLTNPHTMLSGCYEISLKHMSDECGYNKDTIERLLNRFDKIHNLIKYDNSTKEILLLNWCKYNWNKSPKVLKALNEQTKLIKNVDFKAFVEERIQNIDTIWIGYTYPMDTSVTVTDTVTDYVPVIKKDRGTGEGKKTAPHYEDESLNQAFLDFIDMRKKIKKPLTDHAIDLQKKKLKELSCLPFADTMDNELAIKILNQSTMNCWQSLYELKENQQKGNSRQAIDWDNV